jgi:hybrid cluster-associated redox disulfide protein
MNIAALVVAILALAVAYLAVRRVTALEGRLTQCEADLQHARAEWTESRTRLEARLQEITMDVRRHEGGLRFTPNMTIAEALQIHPGVAGVLASFKLSGCSNCSISDVDTLEGACRSYGIDQAALMKALANLLEPAGSSDLLQMARAGRNN